MKLKKRLTIYYVLFDALAALLAWASLFLFRKLDLESPGPKDVAMVLEDANFWLGIIFVPLGWLMLYMVMGAYRDVLHKARLKELETTAISSLIGVVVLFFLLMLDDKLISYRAYYISFLFLLLVHFTLTFIGRLVLTTRTVNGVHNRTIGFPTLMIGSSDMVYKTYLDLENQETYSGERIVGYVDTQQTPSENNGNIQNIIPCMGQMDNIQDLIWEHSIEEVIIALNNPQGDLINKIIYKLCSSPTRDGEPLTIKATPGNYNVVLSGVRQESIFHSPLLTIKRRPMVEWQYSIKRICDIVLSLTAMILLSPVYFVTAIIVKCTSEGPIFYAQERIGYQGKPFKMHKFRSMYVNAEESGPALSKDDDPRITPFGRFMRKVRLDEIPQFYNVFRGTMSLVGPRPERQFYIDQIVKQAPEYLLLQRIKPGITSWGQVKFGYASNVEEMLQRLRYDLLYLDNMTLTTDIKILLYTVIIIIQGRGK